MTLALGHKSVQDMLENVDSHEISEWMAYERAFGPIDNRWRDAALLAIHHELRTGNRMFEGKNWGEEGPLSRKKRDPETNVESDGWVELPSPEEFLRTKEQREHDLELTEDGEESDDDAED